MLFAKPLIASLAICLYAASMAPAAATVTAHLSAPRLPAAIARQLEDKINGCSYMRNIKTGIVSDVTIVLHLGPVGNIKNSGIGAHPSSPNQMLAVGIPGLRAINSCGPYPLPTAAYPSWEHITLDLRSDGKS